MRALTVIFSFQSANPKRGFKSSRMLLYFQFLEWICEIASTTWLYSGHSSPEEHRENDVEKECNNKGDDSDHECCAGYLGYLFQKSAPILTPCSLSSTIR
jgi:hypothetical protein